MIKLSELESWLWEAANILRGPVDAADFKTYIFPLLFFKRICDVYDEEYQKALKESEGDTEFASYAENHQFPIPEGCHWKDVRSHTVNVGNAISNAIRCIENANPNTLYGIFGDAQWANKDRLSDKLLNDLIEHFSMYQLSNSNVEPDITGQAYEYLIKKFADAANKKAGEFYTPRSVVRLMTKILEPKEEETIYDPACGTGGMLLEAVHYVKQNGGDVRTLHLYGQEKNLTTSSIARMNLFLHGVEDFKIIRSDTLRQPAFFEVDKLSTFDCVIANPPFSLKKWGEEIWINDPYGRNFAGLPPQSYGDYAWVQHMIKSMAKTNGRMAVVLPHGALFRKGVEGNIRKKILEMDILEAVIGLGSNLFYGTTLAACILIFRNVKSVKHKNHILFINASKLYEAGRNQNYLLDEHVNQMVTLYKGFDDVKGATRVATIEDIKKNDYNLNITLYVEPIIEEEKMSAQEALLNLKNALKESIEAEERFKNLLRNAKVMA